MKNTFDTLIAELTSMKAEMLNLQAMHGLIISRKQAIDNRMNEIEKDLMQYKGAPSKAVINELEDIELDHNAPMDHNQEQAEQYKILDCQTIAGRQIINMFQRKSDGATFQVGQTVKVDLSYGVTPSKGKITKFEVTDKFASGLGVGIDNEYLTDCGNIQHIGLNSRD